MRKFYLFWILVVLITRVLGQNQHYAHHGMRDLVKGMVCINEKSFYLERRQYFHSNDSLNLVGVSANGTIFLKKPLLLGNSGMLLRKIIATNDKQLAIIYQKNQSCDVIGGSSMISKIDTLGNTVFNSIVVSLAVTPTHSLAIIDMIQHSDSSYYIISASEIHHYSKTGQFISKSSPGIGVMKSISLLNNSNLFVSTTTANYELTIGLNVIQTAMSTDTVLKLVQTSSGKLFSLKQNGQVVRYSPTFSVLSQSQAGSYLLSDFVCRNDSIFTVGYTSVGSPFYKILDSNLAVLYSSGINSYKGIYPVSLALSNKNKLNIAAIAHNDTSLFQSNLAQMNYRTFFRFPLFDSFVLTKDVGVFGYTFLSPLFTPTGWWYDANLEVEVKNYGNQAVQGFNLNSKYWPLCNQSWQKWYDTIIPPNATVKVKTGVIKVGGEGNTSLGKVKLCLYTSTPDNKADLNPNNDFFCDSVVATATALYENNYNELQLQIYPNPMSNYFQVVSNSKIKKIELFTSFGMTHELNMLDAKVAEVHTEDLAIGIYFLKVETEKGVVVKKVVKN